MSYEIYIHNEYNVFGNFQLLCFLFILLLCHNASKKTQAYLSFLKIYHKSKLPETS